MLFLKTDMKFVLIDRLRILMALDELQNIHRDDILTIAELYGVRHVRLFGSTVREKAEPGSDVDVVTKAGLHWYIRDHILEEAVPL